MTQTTLGKGIKLLVMAMKHFVESLSKASEKAFSKTRELANSYHTAGTSPKCSMTWSTTLGQDAGDFYGIPSAADSTLAALLKKS